VRALISTLNAPSRRVKWLGGPAARAEAPPKLPGNRKIELYPGPIVSGGLVVPGPIVSGGLVDRVVVVAFFVVVVCFLVVVVGLAVVDVVEAEVVVGCTVVDVMGVEVVVDCTVVDVMGVEVVVDRKVVPVVVVTKSSGVAAPPRKARDTPVPIAATRTIANAATIMIRLRLRRRGGAPPRASAALGTPGYGTPGVSVAWRPY
jgi:hypothetical protein